MRGRRGHMVVGFTTTCAISAYHHYKVVSSNLVHGEIYLIQHYVIKFVSDLRQVVAPWSEAIFCRFKQLIQQFLMTMMINEQDGLGLVYGV
jgi:hypothetical protein